MSPAFSMVPGSSRTRMSLNSAPRKPGAFSREKRELRETGPALRRRRGHRQPRAEAQQSGGEMVRPLTHSLSSGEYLHSVDLRSSDLRK